MELRDDVETILRRWDIYEKKRDGPDIIDYDCHPSAHSEIEPVKSRLEVVHELERLQRQATMAEEARLAERIGAHLTFAGALLGERLPINDYVRRTQGCDAAGWPDETISQRGERARRHLGDLGIAWDPYTKRHLTEAEGPLEIEILADTIRQAAEEFEPLVRSITQTDAEFNLSIETVDVDAYWAFWLDGYSQEARLRLNRRKADFFTQVRARQFALHEVLGHALQFASWAYSSRAMDVSWVRLLTVHSQEQVLLEGLAQALPLFIAPTDRSLLARVYLDHYLMLVRAELHLAINQGVSASECGAYGRARVPFWTDEDIANALSDTGGNPLLRSYLWAYPAGMDWFVALAETEDSALVSKILGSAFREPLMPTDLEGLWPAGPAIGGPGTTIRLRYT